jgi:hypothetical protein
MAHEKNQTNELTPEWISICAMLSQNAGHPYTKGTMTLQKLTLLWMLEEKGKAEERKVNWPKRQKENKNKEVKQSHQRSRS